MPETPADDRQITVAIVCICSAEHLKACLTALRAQLAAPSFEVLVAADPTIPGLDEVRAMFPEARIMANPAYRTPPEIACLAITESTGQTILFTEDHCVPASEWVCVMIDAMVPGRAVVGGRIDIAPGANRLEWAFYFVDFFRYAWPVTEGASPTLSVCNIGYRRAELDEIGDVWSDVFVEPVVNAALKNRFGSLWLEPRSKVVMLRRVRLRAGLRERFTGGQLFGSRRAQLSTATKRLSYVVLGLGLPILLFARMAVAATRSRRLFVNFIASFGFLFLLTLAWAWGEWLGYLTGRAPRAFATAPEVRR